MLCWNAIAFGLLNVTPWSTVSGLVSRKVFPYVVAGDEGRMIQEKNLHLDTPVEIKPLLDLRPYDEKQLIDVLNEAKTLEQKGGTPSNLFGDSNAFSGPNSFNGSNALNGPNAFNGPNTLNVPNALNGPNVLNGPSALNGLNDLNGPSTLNGPNALSAPNVWKNPEAWKNPNVWKDLTNRYVLHQQALEVTTEQRFGFYPSTAVYAISFLGFLPFGWFMIAGGSDYLYPYFIKAAAAFSLHAISLAIMLNRGNEPTFSLSFSFALGLIGFLMAFFLKKFAWWICLFSFSFLLLLTLRFLTFLGPFAFVSIFNLPNTADGFYLFVTSAACCITIVLILLVEYSVTHMPKRSANKATCHIRNMVYSAVISYISAIVVFSGLGSAREILLKTSSPFIYLKILSVPGTLFFENGLLIFLVAAAGAYVNFVRYSLYWDPISRKRQEFLKNKHLLINEEKADSELSPNYSPSFQRRTGPFLEESETPSSEEERDSSADSWKVAD